MGLSKKVLILSITLCILSSSSVWSLQRGDEAVNSVPNSASASNQPLPPDPPLNPDPPIPSSSASPSASSSSSESSSQPSPSSSSSSRQLFQCPEGEYETFELITGSVYSSPGDTLETIPGTLKLTECLESCQKNSSCQSVNYETGLCILSSSSASSSKQDQSGSAAGLQPSQYPVFTIYAQKVCLPVRSDVSSAPHPCSGRLWSFERVVGFELRKFPKKKLSDVPSRISCMDSCLYEKEFVCRSFNYDESLRECVLSEQDRHTLAVPQAARSKDPPSLLPSANGTVDYYESNCIIGGSSFFISSSHTSSLLIYYHLSLGICESDLPLFRVIFTSWTSQADPQDDHQLSIHSIPRLQLRIHHQEEHLLFFSLWDLHPLQQVSCCAECLIRGMVILTDCNLLVS